MKKRKNRFKNKKHQDIFFFLVLGVLIIGFLAFLAVSNIRILRKRTALKAQIAALEEEIQTQDKRNQMLREGIEKVTDKEFLEKVAREKFLLKEKGEEVIVVSPPEGQEEKPLPEKKNFFEQILEKLKFLPF